MILTVDVGNTNTIFSCYNDDKMIITARVATDKLKMYHEYAIMIKTIFQIEGYDPKDIKGAIVSSVVPSLVDTMKDAIRFLSGVEALSVGPGIKTGINIKIDNPAQLGSDFVCVSVSAKNKYPLPSVVIDMGTATTFSAMDKDGGLLGGSILPGVKISLGALSDKTAMLQDISYDSAPQSVIGKNTIDAMKSGIIYGNASMIDGMIRKYKEELGENTTVIATGGLANLIIKSCKEEIIYDENLLSDGLYDIYKLNKI